MVEGCGGQMSHMERNSVRAAYIHKAEHLDERKLMLQWWADFLDANREKGLVHLILRRSIRVMASEMFVVHFNSLTKFRNKSWLIYHYLFR
jgi:hypothetical protein